MQRILRLALAICACATRAAASDWPQFLGPERTGHYTGPALAAQWPLNGPKPLWKKSVGEGFSGPAIAGPNLILFHRLNNREIVECLVATNANPVWKFDYPATYRDRHGFDEGPRATPTISGDRVFTFGADGLLHCLDLKSGSKLWDHNARTEFGADQGFFGWASSPLLLGDAVIIQIGGPKGEGIVAFQKQSGLVLWKATSHEAGYASPTLASFNTRSRVLALTREALVILDPANGNILASKPWRARMDASVNAASPIAFNDKIFLTSSYGVGAILLRFADNRIETLWSGDSQLSAHYATPVYHNGFLYGFHGRQESGASFRCIEAATGKVRWDNTDVGAGTVTLAANTLLVLTERGELIQFAASPDNLKELNRAQILPFECRAYPALADARLYARSKDTLVCVDLGP